MKMILSIIAFLAVTMGVHAQSENPKENDELQQKYISLVDSLYTWGEWWQLEQLCNEKADSISDDILAFGRGLTASRFFQIEEAKKQLSMCLSEYNETLPDTWIDETARVLANCMKYTEEYEEAAKVLSDAHKYFSSDEELAKEFQSSIAFYQNSIQRFSKLAKYPAMTFSCDDSGVVIPFRMDSVGNGTKAVWMFVDGTLQDKSVSMVFDTGYAGNCVTRKIADELQLRATDVGVNINGSSMTRTSYVIADSLRIGNVVLRNIKFSVFEDKQLPSGINMIIGQSIMQKMPQFTMDFEKRIITSSPKLTEYPNKNFTVSPGGLLLVRIFHKGKSIDMNLDTGNGEQSHLDYRFYIENKNQIDQLEIESRRVGGAGGTFRAEYAIMKDFNFMLNGQQYTLPIVTVIKEKLNAALAKNNMGLSFLSSFKRVTISYKDAHIEFE